MAGHVVRQEAGAQAAAQARMWATVRLCARAHVQIGLHSRMSSKCVTFAASIHSPTLVSSLASSRRCGHAAPAITALRAAVRPALRRRGALRMQVPGGMEGGSRTCMRFGRRAARMCARSAGLGAAAASTKPGCGPCDGVHATVSMQPVRRPSQQVRRLEPARACAAAANARHTCEHQRLQVHCHRAASNPVTGPHTQPPRRARTHACAI